MAKNIVIGDIIEIPTSKGLTYAQCSHIHPSYLHLIRVLPGFFRQRPTDFNELAAQKELFVVFYPIEGAVNKRFLDIAFAGHADVPEHARKFPIFRFGLANFSTNKVETWWFWDGIKRWKVGHITQEQMKMPCQEIWTGSTLVERIEQGWTWEKCDGSWERTPNNETNRANNSGLPDTQRKLDSVASNSAPVEYYFYFPSKDAAERAAAELRTDHFAVEVVPGALDDGKWLALASHSVMPREPAIADLRDKFEDLAARYGGEYDGWQAKVSPTAN